MSSQAIAYLAAGAVVSLPVSSAHAQSVVSVCSGVSLPRSVVTTLAGQVVSPVITPIQGAVNGLLGILGPVTVNVTDAVNAASVGAPIKLGAIGVNGQEINLTTNPQCVTQSDAFQLTTPAGLAFGGNQITGLGTTGRLATATATNAIAIGDAANTSAAALGAVAIGDSARVTAGGTLGSVALGQNSLATGATLGDQAYLVGGTAPAEVNIGSRRLTGVAGGSADNDAVNVAQLRAAALAVSGDSLTFDSTLNAYSAQRAGVSQRITNVAPGSLVAGSTDAVNGAQLGATNNAVAGNTANITTVTAGVAGLQADALLYDGTLAAYNAGRAGVAQKVTNVAAGTLVAGSTEAVNGAQLGATNDLVAGNTSNIATLGGSVTTLNTNVTALQTDALQYDGTLAAYNAGRGGVAQKVTNVAAGTLVAGSTEAVNGAQLGATNDLVAGNTSNIATLGGSVTTLNTNVTALQTDALQYDGTLTAFDASRGGVAQKITSVAAGRLGAGSTEAVNGEQLGATNDLVAGNTANITTLGGSVTALNTNVTALQTDALQYDGTLAAFDASRGGVAQKITSVAAGRLGAGSTEAVNGAQLGATNDAVALNTTTIANINTSVTGLQGDALLYDNALQAYSANRGGLAQRVTNIAAGALGAGSLDAVNGSQLSGLGTSFASSLGGGSTYDPATGQVTAGITYRGNTYDSVQGAVSAIETSAGGTTTGTNSRYFRANSVMADSQAVGSDSTAIGPNAAATADGAIAAGRNTSAGSAGSVAIGDGSTTTAGKAVAIGSLNVASGDGAVAIGDPNIATGDGAVALGRDNQATGIGAVALGDTNFATGDSAVSMGQNNNATGVGAVAIGSTNTLTGAGAVTIGSNNTVNGAQALAFGTGNQVSGDGSLAFGANITATGNDTLAVGNDTAATLDSAAAFGNRAAATGAISTAIGTDATASAQYGLALGGSASATGYASTALGTGAVATALGSVAIGTGSSATELGSIALGGASSTLRGASVGYTAFGLGAAQTTVGEVAIGRTIAYPNPITGVPQPTGERQITGVGAGSADTDAVNVAQLRGVSGALGTAISSGFGGGSTYDAATGTVTGPTYVINGTTYNNVGAALAGVAGTGGAAGPVATGSVSYDTPARDLVTLGGGAGTRVTNVAPATLAAGSTDAVNGGQLFATNQQVGANTTAIDTLRNTVVGSTITPVQYSNAGTPTTPNGGVVTNDVTLVGANAAAPVALHNIADGTMAAGSTDAVNGRQLNAVSQTAQAAQLTATEAAALGRNSLQYDTDGGSVTLANPNGAPVALRNVAAGISAADAANVGQLNAGVDRAISTSNAYTDTRFGQLSYDLKSVRRDASGGTAAAMAMGMVPQAYGPGMGMAGVGVSTWRGESAIAFGASKASANGRVVVKAAASYNTRGQGGAAGGIGFGF